MAATTIRELLVAIGVDAGDADKQVRRIDTALNDLKSVMTAVVAGGAAVVGAITGVAISASNAASAVNDGAARVALSAEAYQELGYQARQTGSSVEELEQGLTHQNKAVEDAIKKGKTHIDVAKGVNLALTDGHGKLLTQEQLMYRAADAIQHAKSEQEQLAIATTLYGRSGNRLLPMLKDGSKGMAAMAAQARALGVVISGADVAAGDTFGDTLDDVTGLVGGLKNEIGFRLLPVLTDLLTSFREWFKANKSVIDQKLKEWTDYVVRGMEAVKTAAVEVDATVRQKLGGWELVFRALAIAAGIFAGAMTAIGALKVWGAINGALTTLEVIGAAVGLTLGEVLVVIAAVIAAVVGLYLAIEDLLTYLQGGDSALGRFLATAQSSEGILGSVARLLLALGRLFLAVGQLAQVGWGAFLQAIDPGVQRAERLLGALARILGLSWDGTLANWAQLIDLLARAVDLAAQLLGTQSALTAAAATGGSVGRIAGAALGDATSPVPTVTDYLPGGSLYASTSAAFAPSPAAVGGGSPGPTTTTSNQNVTVQGNTYNITGATTDDIARAVEEGERRSAAHTAAALEGGEV
jgi:hypothetical protein